MIGMSRLFGLEEGWFILELEVGILNVCTYSLILLDVGRGIVYSTKIPRFRKLETNRCLHTQNSWSH